VVRRRSDQSLLQLSRPARRNWRRNKAAIIWEGEPGDVRTFTYQQLLTEVSKFANVLKSLGIQKGDTVAIYMGMTPELP
jgi:acetyl-CoA synthetase